MISLNIRANSRIRRHPKPRLKDLDNPEVAPWLRKAFKTNVSADKRLRIMKFLQHWTAGLHGRGTWHGAGQPATKRVMIQLLTDFDKKKELATKLMGLEDDQDTARPADR